MEVSTFTEYLSISAKIAQDDWRTKSRNQGLNISYAPRQTKKSPKRKEKLVHKYQMEVTRKGATSYHSWTGKAPFHEARRKESRIEWTREVKKKELTRLVRDRDPQKIVWGNASGSCFYCVFVFFFLWETLFSCYEFHFTALKSSFMNLTIYFTSLLHRSTLPYPEPNAFNANDHKTTGANYKIPSIELQRP